MLSLPSLWISELSTRCLICVSRPTAGFPTPPGLDSEAAAGELPADGGVERGAFEEAGELDNRTDVAAASLSPRSCACMLPNAVDC